MMAELSTPKTQARIFSYFAFSGNLGIFLGPLIGGVLANPAAQYPRLFGKINFLHEFPYALPTIVTGSLGIIASVICAIVIKEVSSPCLVFSNTQANPDSPYIRH